MGKFAENLNLGNRVRPPLHLQLRAALRLARNRVCNIWRMSRTTSVPTRWWKASITIAGEVQTMDTINDKDMPSYSLTTMMCFLTKEWYDFPAYTVNLFIKAYHKITYKEDLKIT